MTCTWPEEDLKDSVQDFESHMYDILVVICEKSSKVYIFIMYNPYYMPHLSDYMQNTTW